MLKDCHHWRAIQLIIPSLVTTGGQKVLAHNYALLRCLKARKQPHWISELVILNNMNKQLQMIVKKKKRQSKKKTQTLTSGLQPSFVRNIYQICSYLVLDSFKSHDHEKCALYVRYSDHEFSLSGLGEGRFQRFKYPLLSNEKSCRESGQFV